MKKIKWFDYIKWEIKNKKSFDNLFFVKINFGRVNKIKK